MRTDYGNRTFSDDRKQKAAVTDQSLFKCSYLSVKSFGVSCLRGHWFFWSFSCPNFYQPTHPRSHSSNHLRYFLMMTNSLRMLFVVIEPTASRLGDNLVNHWTKERDGMIETNFKWFFSVVRSCESLSFVCHRPGRSEVVAPDWYYFFPQAISNWLLSVLTSTTRQKDIQKGKTSHVEIPERGAREIILPERMLPQKHKFWSLY